MRFSCLQLNVQLELTKFLVSKLVILNNKYTVRLCIKIEEQHFEHML